MSLLTSKLPRTTVYSQLVRNFYSRRREALQDWMRSILKVACFSQSDELWHFLTDSKVYSFLLFHESRGRLLIFRLSAVNCWRASRNPRRERQFQTSNSCELKCTGEMLLFLDKQASEFQVYTIIVLQAHSRRLKI